jgi:hypothetical protein
MARLDRATQGYMRQWKIELIECDNPQWRDLSHTL